jgi:hypothetical protein
VSAVSTTSALVRGGFWGAAAALRRFRHGGEGTADSSKLIQIPFTGVTADSVLDTNIVPP